MQKQPKQQWNGKEVPADENPDSNILVWEVTPHPGTSEYDYYLARSGPTMMDYVTNNLDILLERFTEEELREGVNIRFRLVKMARREYDEGDLP